jgi:two-component system KDP operon response regulator KdpE
MRQQITSGGRLLNVLVIEDNKQVLCDITLCLQVRYPEVIFVSAADGQKGMELLEKEVPDLVLLDSSLPDIDSLDLVNRIREFSDAPLVILSDVGTDMDGARYLEAGADSYVTKPLSPIYFLAKIKALLRRAQGIGFKRNHFISAGNLSIYTGTQEVFLSGKRVKLTPIEYQLFLELVRNGGRVLTHNVLLEKVWGSEYEKVDGFIKKYIYRLRSKLESDASNPQIILTERGIGYKFVQPI